MSADITKQELSGSTDGNPILITVTSGSSSGDLIHTSVAVANEWDEVWLWAVNNDTIARLLTLQYGGTTNPNNTVPITIPAQSGLTLVLPGTIMGNGKVLRAICASANKVSVLGYVNRIVNES